MLNWCNHNNLSLNINKYKSITFTCAQKNNSYNSGYFSFTYLLNKNKAIKTLILIEYSCSEFPNP